VVPVAGLEADGVDARHYSAHYLFPWQARPRPGPAQFANLPGRVALAGVDRDEAQLGGLVQALTDQVDRVHLAGAAQPRAVGGQQADRARAEHGDGVGRPDAR
jgi:hypothetical protein